MIKKSFFVNILLCSYVLAQEEAYIPSPTISIIPSVEKDLNLNIKEENKVLSKDTYEIKDDEYQTNITIWDRNLSFFKMTPKFNIENFKSKSNINIYSFDKTNYFLSLEKSF